MHNDPLLQILMLLAASVCVVAGVRKLRCRRYSAISPSACCWVRTPSVAVDNDTTRLLAEFGVVFLVFTLGPGILAAAPGRHALGGARRRAARRCLVTTGVVAAGAIALIFDIAPAVAVVDRRRGGDVLDGRSSSRS